jgi:hypothetical protein
MDVSDWVTSTGQEFGLDLSAQVDVLAQNGTFLCVPALHAAPFLLSSDERGE